VPVGLTADGLVRYGGYVSWIDRLLDKRIEAAIATRAALVGEPTGIRIGGLGTSPTTEDSATGEKMLAYCRTSNPVYACATIRASMLSALPLRAYKLGKAPKGGRTRYGRTIDVRDPKTRYGMPAVAHGRSVADAGEVTEVESGGLVDLLSGVNPRWTLRRLIQSTEMSLCLSGQAFWTLDRGQEGKRPPSAIYYVKHTRMQVIPHPSDIVSGWIQDDMTSAKQDLTPGEVLWFRFADPLDPDYGALPPMAAARLGADVYRAAMRNNWAIFANGLAPGGWVFPPEGQTWDEEQLQDAQEAVRQRLEGVERRHRWLFMPEPYVMQPNTMTPKDAEFLGGLDFAVEDVARAFGLPIELVGGARRTYQNLENALRGVWMFTLEPEAGFIAGELTEQLAPMFGSEVDFVAFDLSGVSALQDDETAEWARSKEQLASYALTINEWRATQGMDPVAWGDAAWMPLGVAPVTEPVAPPKPPAAAPPMAAPDGLAAAAPSETREGTARTPSDPPAASDATPTVGVEYGSPEHVARWERVVKTTTPLEGEFRALVVDLFERQQASMLDKMRGADVDNTRDMMDDFGRWFDVKRWTKTFRVEAKPLLSRILRAGADASWSDLSAPGDPNMGEPAMLRFLTGRAQRFAEEVNATTWDSLKASLRDGIASGEGMPDLMARVTAGMGDRIRSSAEVIARTETLGAYNGGGLQAAKQSGLSDGKRWHSAMDARTRPTHISAHGQTVRLDEDFEVGGASGPCPGSMGAAEEDCNCRCAVQYIESAIEGN
jgi:HK97 family phage portal protein